MELGLAQEIEDGAYLSRGEKLAVRIVSCSLQLLLQRGIAVYPSHEVAGGGARVAVGEVEHGKLLFAVTVYFHCRVEMLVITMAVRMPK